MRLCILTCPGLDIKATAPPTPDSLRSPGALMQSPSGLPGKPLLSPEGDRNRAPGDRSESGVQRAAKECCHRQRNSFITAAPTTSGRTLDQNSRTRERTGCDSTPSTL